MCHFDMTTTVWVPVGIRDVTMGQWRHDDGMDLAKVGGPCNRDDTHGRGVRAAPFLEAARFRHFPQPPCCGPRGRRADAGVRGPARASGRDVDTITGLADASVAENTAYSATASASGRGGKSKRVFWSKEGTDATLFTLDANTGALSMGAQDYENPTDANTDNVYEVTVNAADKVGRTATQAIRITVTDAIETATVTISGLSDASVEENTAYSATAMAGGAIGTVIWSKEGSLFTLDANTGVLSMVGRDYENPATRTRTTSTR